MRQYILFVCVIVLHELRVYVTCQSQYTPKAYLGYTGPSNAPERDLTYDEKSRKYLLADCVDSQVVGGRASCDGCFPSDHSYNESYFDFTIQGTYCSDISEGSGDDSDKMWNWWSVPDGYGGSKHVCMSTKITGKRCACTASCLASDCKYYGTGASGACRCAMKGDHTQHYCFTRQSNCKLCDAGKYNSGCGCRKMKEGETGYDRYRYWRCSEGECKPNPPDFYSNVKSVTPTRCPFGSTTHGATGATACSQCWGSEVQCAQNQYLDPNIRPENCCPRTPALDTQYQCPGGRQFQFSAERDCKSCTSCTDISRSYANNCPYKPNQFDSEINMKKQCLHVTTCEAWALSVSKSQAGLLQPYTQYADPNIYTDKLVLVDDTDYPIASVCKYMYDSNVVNAGIGPNATATEANISSGKAGRKFMPYRYGYARREGKFGFVMAKFPRSSGDFQADRLAYYQECASFIRERQIPGSRVQIPDGFVSMSNSDVREMLDVNFKYLSLYGEWDNDCYYELTHVCAANRSAVLARWFIPDLGMVSNLVACNACPLHSTSPLGLGETCTCDSGFARMSELHEAFQKQNFQSILPSSSCGVDYVIRSTEGLRGSIDGVCYDCSADLNIHCPNGVMYRQAVICRRTDGVLTVTKCDAGSYVSNGACVPVTDGYITDAGQRMQIPCPAGTFAIKNQNLCQSCAATMPNSYSLAASSACTPKRQNCSSGQMLNLDPSNYTGDDQCTSCRDCDAGYIKVVQVGYNSSNPCVGDRFRHFACVADSPAYGSFVPAGWRVAFNPSNNDDAHGNGYDRVILERCNSSLLPPYSDFVASPGSQAVRQCYFACRYDLGLGAVALQAKLARLWAGDDIRSANNRIGSFYMTRFVPFGAQDQLKVRVPQRWAEDGTGQIRNTGSWTVTQFASTTAFHSDASDRYAQQAIFYFNDEILAAILGNNSDICMPPAKVDRQCSGTLYPGANAQHMWQVEPGLANVYCAQLAVTTGIYSIIAPYSHNVQYVVMGLDTLSHGQPVYAPLCVANMDHTDDVDRISGWSYVCMQEQADAMYGIVEKIMGSSFSGTIGWPTEYNLLMGMRRWLDPYYWDLAFSTASVSPLFNPYQYNTSTNSVGCTSGFVPEGGALLSGSVTITFTPSNVAAVSAVRTLLRYYGFEGVSACVPCNAAGQDVLNAYCNRLSAGGQAALSFDPSLCVKLGHGISEVCSNCQTSDDMQLVPQSSDAWTRFASAVTSSVFWDGAKKCRYFCPSTKCSTAANGVNSYADYLQTPCISCATLKQQARCDVGMYVNAQAVCGSAVDLHVNMCPAMCQTCTVLNSSLQLKLLPFLGLGARSLAECVTMCDSTSYHTLLDSGEFTTVPVNQSRIVACVPCASVPGLVCRDSCPLAKWYQPNNQSCLVCNTSACGKGYYRMGCTDNKTMHDTVCTSCDASLLRNPPVISTYAPLSVGWRRPDIGRRVLDQALNSVGTVETRLWLQALPEYEGLPADVLFTTYGALFVSPDDMTSGSAPCYIACRNGMVWVDGNGDFPTVNMHYDPRQLWCIPCNSVFFNDNETSETAYPSRTLYSVWNQNLNVSAIPQLSTNPNLIASMGKKGACYNCLDYRYYTDDRDILCIMKPGFTDVPNVPGAIVAVQLSSESGGVLQARGGQNVYDIPSVQADIHLPTGWVFGCCRNAQLTNSEFGTCTGMKSLSSFKAFICTKYSSLYQIKTATCLNIPDVSRILSSYTCGNYSDLVRNYTTERYNWTSYGGRRLLSSSPSSPSTSGTRVAACLAGEYKRTSGGGPCSQCPDGASTVFPWNALTSADRCACLPGYYATREASTGRLLSCSPCGPRHYSVYPSTDDTACLPCPNNTVAPTATSGYCTCVDGTYRVSANGGGTQCIPCPVDAYCIGEQLFQCPPYSSTPATADRTSRSSCVCNAGYYGDLGSFYDAVCQPLPLAVVCAVGAGMVQDGGRCLCASGWRSQWNGNRLSCMLDMCSLGTYALLSVSGDVRECVPCPRNTFSSSSQMVYNPLRALNEQCTPCPLGFQTIGNGSKSLSACTCGGVTIRAEGNQSAACGTCQNNTWYDALTQSCSTCAANMVATSNGCACRAGWQLDPAGAGCVKCPLGYYSTTVSISCSPCPSGRTTLLTGQTWCVCQTTGLPPRMGMCI